MLKRLRFSIPASAAAILFILAPFYLLPLHAHSMAMNQMVPRRLSVLTPSLYNNVSLPRPYWWGGSGQNCDTNNPHGYQPLLKNGVPTTFRGQYVCGPMPENYSNKIDYPVYFPKGSQVQVNEWECTEWAMRYLYLAYGIPPYVANGGQVAANYTGALLTRVFNKAGSGNVPSPGDVLSLTNSGQGHVVVVANVSGVVKGTGPIQVVDENGIPGLNKTNGTGTATFQDTNYLIDGSTDGGTVDSWLHPNTLVTSANANTYNSLLYAVDAMGAHNGNTTDLSNVWAVGDTAVNNVFQTLIERWDGGHWSVIPNTPNLGIGDDLYGVAVLSPTNIWAVGRYYDNSHVAQTLFLHYNGTSWIASTHGPGQLYAITRVSGSEAWAVGTSNTGPQTELTYHLVGSTWTPVTDTSENVILTAVSASSATNVWAVGYSTGGISTNTVTLHWTGGPSWTVVPSPNPGSAGNELLGVTAINANTAWAVGQSNLTPNGDGFVMEWTSQSGWGQPYNLPFTSENTLLSVASLSPTNIWAVGRIGLSTFVEHYNGSGWKQIPSVDIGYDLLQSVMVNRANGNVWAVGQYQTYGVQAQTLTEFFN